MQNLWQRYLKWFKGRVRMELLVRGRMHKERKLAALKSKMQEKGMRVLTGKKDDKVHNRQFAGGKGA